MDNFFQKIKVGVLNDHFDVLGGGTVHSFKFVEFLKQYYDVDVFLPGTPKSPQWLHSFLRLNTTGVNVYPYRKGCGLQYPYLFLNISHWRAEPTNALKKFMLVFFPQFYFPLYDYKFLANSEYTCDNIVSRWKVDKERVEVVYPPINTALFTPAANKQNWILHVSRITPPVPESDKGHKQMIETFKRLVDNKFRGWQLHIVGQVQDTAYFASLQAMTGGYPIFFHPSVNFEELQKIYALSKIYWHITGISMPDQPGAQEHFGMTTVEAMAAGCVPIVLNTGGQPEIVTNELEGYLVNNLAELEARTLELTKDDEKQQTMSVLSYSRARCFDEDHARRKFFSAIAKTDKVSIIIVCWNNSAYTKACVDRLYQVTPPGFELILVDNASTDDTHEVLEQLKEKHPDIITVYNEKNVGFAKGNNIGLKHASCDYICYLNNDTLPQWGWLEQMVDVLENRKDVGIVGARLYFNQDSEGRWKIQHAGIQINSGEISHIGRFQTDNQVRGIGVEEVEAVTGACMLVRSELAHLNEDYVRGYYEDIDLCLSAREKGYRVVINHQARLIHYEGTSQNILKSKDNTTFAKITEQNRALFQERWPIDKIKSLPKPSMTPDLSGVSHEERIEIGGGERPIYSHYAQVDLRRLPTVKYINDARLLPFPANSVQDICSSYLINCFKKEDAEMALREWLRCLRPGGRLELYFPDIIAVVKDLMSTKEETLMHELYGRQEHELDYFQWGYTFESMDRLLSQVGFVRVTKIKAHPSHPHAMGIAAYKQIE